MTNNQRVRRSAPEHAKNHTLQGHNKLQHTDADSRRRVGHISAGARGLEKVSHAPVPSLTGTVLYKPAMSVPTYECKQTVLVFCG